MVFTPLSLLFKFQFVVLLAQQIENGKFQFIVLLPI